ncbi:ran guanine nucleotide release factor [Astyanax mexicanus]|uniref:Ran guanine nucleotide release factor n=1 Tax=Astyanax mexicanus TaxID=7994 RepID=A0A8T2MJ40_ASTMX|nr:ran guanine nucleotide release factor [Astyanax mexicanus]XP_049337880.1 ran guanine nucleotide release factor [Astyanax mexicanus]XP_049337931.1 ran guanine nucleotide release factor [Astyanax mexicanus]KAG9281496.1 ran guanine nucleotide release factor [Astyanax mexicanus]
MARPLFGGALSALIPSNATDVSELREVPDNQEVFVHSQTDQSVIIELMEYQDQVDDAQAARYHFEDLAGSNKASAEGLWEVQGVEPLPLSQLRLQECSSAWILTGTQIISKFNEEAKNTVNMYLCVMRLPQFTTDILLTFNHPVTISPLSSSAGVGEDGGWTLQDFHTLLKSLQLLDPGVFG